MPHTHTHPTCFGLDSIRSIKFPKNKTSVMNTVLYCDIQKRENGSINK